MKTYILNLLLVSSLFAGTYDDPYTPIKLEGVTATKHVDQFMDGTFEKIIRFDALEFSDRSFSEDSKENFEKIVSTIEDYIEKDEKIKVTIIGHARERTDISQELTVDSDTYANNIQNMFRFSQDQEETQKHSDDFATTVTNKLLDNNISQEILVKEYRSSTDMGYTTATTRGQELSNRVKVTIYILERDDDKDGVLNFQDKCPNTPLGVEVDADGCCIDTDKDGVCDYLDKCPDTPLDVEVDKDGCPLDTDEDGVLDYLDKCPGTEKGLVVDGNGCPSMITLRLNYATDSAVIPESDYHKVVEFAEFMNANTPYNANIVGHTDSVSSEEYNVGLSHRRANGVKAALIEEGISEDRLETEGRGEVEPIEDNMLKSGRAMNRRIEVSLSN